MKMRADPVWARQCAAVRTARGAMTVPEHAPERLPSASRRLMRTTGEFDVVHVAPLVIAVAEDTAPSAPHAALIGTVGVGVGDEGGGEKPPPQAVNSAARQTESVVRTRASYRERHIIMRRSRNEEDPMSQPEKCAHPACSCTVPEKGEWGKYCSEHCKHAGGMTELRCGCQHPECR